MFRSIRCLYFLRKITTECLYICIFPIRRICESHKGQNKLTSVLKYTMLSALRGLYNCIFRIQSHLLHKARVLRGKFETVLFINEFIMTYARCGFPKSFPASAGKVVIGFVTTNPFNYHSISFIIQCYIMSVVDSE